MPPRSQILAKRGRWLLDLDVGGTVYRFATDEVTVADDAGVNFVYEPGLDPVSLSQVDRDGESLSVPIRIHAGVDWALLVARGIQLERRRATLRRHFDGQTMEQTRIWVRGVSLDVEYETREDPLEFSLARASERVAMVLPSPQMRVDSNTWPRSSRSGYTLDEKAEGVGYNMVIGYPGSRPSTGRGVVPGVMVELHASNTDEIMLIAGHATEVGRDGGDVRVWDFSDDPPSKDDLAASQITDDLGRTVTVVDTSGTSLTIAAGRDYYVGFTTAEGGGLLRRDGSGAMRGAGEVITRVLTDWTAIREDAGRLEAMRMLLDAYKIDTFLNEPTNMWEWLQDEVLPLLPVTPMEGPDGLYLQTWPWQATKEDAVWSFDADRGDVVRVSAVRTLNVDVANQIAVNYRPDRQNGGFLQRVVVTGTAEPAQIQGFEVLEEAAARVLLDAACAWSQSVLADPDDQTGASGIRSLEIDAFCVWDRTTAELIATTKAAELALPKRRVLYEGPQELEALPVGAVVRLTDSEVHLTDVVAFARDVIVEEDTVILELILLDDPYRTLRAT